MKNSIQDRPSSGSLYMQVRDYILRLISEKYLGKGDKLPSERELAEACGCTRVTLREALLHLEHEGYIYRKMRQGWFMAPPPLIYDPSSRVIFSKLVQEQDRHGATYLVQAQKISAPVASVRQALGLEVGTDVIEIIRCRSLEGRAVLLEEIYFDATRFSYLLKQDLELSITGLLAEHSGVEITQEDARIRTGALDIHRANLLAVAQGTPCLSLTRSRLDKAGTCIEYDREYWLHNAVEIRISGHK